MDLHGFTLTKVKFTPGFTLETNLSLAQKYGENLIFVMGSIPLKYVL